MMPKITVEQIVKRKAIVIKPTETVERVAKILAKNKVSSAVVMEKDEITGIVTDRDILNKVVAKGNDPKEVKVSSIMTKTPITIEYDYDIQDAIELMMEKGVRRLLVTRLGMPMGFVTAADLLAALNAYNQEEEEESIEEAGEVYGICEVCGQYAQLHRVIREGYERWVCESCKDMLES
ncbi:MAG TPA: CBS domain-containing protein [Thermococcus sp.]|uniref:CBS domain-containing protein n=1 Tax=Thermococcus sp. TaxID=35749 RepID=UPI000BD6245C|nr:CBS domain-containing protein [Thermococcus sp.]OYT33138.1 MAG: inosine-5-monophosphate dehydrogenase [Archaeoglobales archaeon ex4484_92]RLF75137.1 MAG: CBS domain-containing protein [Thermococci archaeon]MCD6140416.1 CBS domain-containing protein [Thermococcus sp.]MCD6142920.1 CBS domain-containing protein [Thermococcus sp.]RLF80257.1 MAG: CBS domain-containing protein [Thermococci archaeon]